MSSIMMQLLGSGAAGGADGWWLEVSHTGQSNTMFQGEVMPAASGNTVFVTGGVDGSTKIPVLEINENGGIDTQNYITQDSGTNSYYGKTLDLDSSGNLWVGGLLSGSGSRCARHKTNKGAVSGTDNQFLQSNVSRGGFNSIRSDGSNNYNMFTAYDTNSGNVKSYIRKYDSSESVQFDKAVHNGNTTYAREMYYGFSAGLYLSITNAQNPSYGGYAHDIVGVNLAGAINLQRRYYHSSGTGASGAGEGRSVKELTNHLLLVGYDSANTGGKENYNSFSIKKTDNAGKISGASVSGVYQKKYVIKSGTTYYQSEAKACDVDSSGNLYGIGRGPNSTNAIWKFNSDGAVQWCQIIYNTAGGNRNASTASTQLNGICIGNDGQLYVSGFSYPTSSNTYYGLVGKLNPDGMTAGTYGNIVIADLTTEELTTYPTESSYNGYQSDDVASPGMQAATYAYSNSTITSSETLSNL